MKIRQKIKVITEKICISIKVFKEIIIGIMKMTDKKDGGQDQEIEILDRDPRVMIEREITMKLFWKRISNFI